MSVSGAGVLSVDWRTSLRRARELLGEETALQGNLDPSLLFGPVGEVRRKTAEILDEMKGDRGFIFNLGHGVLPETPVESVRALVETVQARD
jgi:uroporphyrinogen decarboxylase